MNKFNELYHGVIPGLRMPFINLLDLCKPIIRNNKTLLLMWLQEQVQVNRGYYMAARGIRVLSERYVQHENIQFVSTSGHVMFCLFYRY